MLSILIGLSALTPAVEPVADQSKAIVSFAANVQPVIVKAGCAARACHGAEGGQSGFQLTLFQYDPDADALAIAQASGGRRINHERPEDSLLLKKPTGQLPHGGGKRFDANSPEYKALLQWIEAGAKPDDDQTPYLTDLSIQLPVERFDKANQKAQARVLATFSNGVRQDVTPLCLFSVTDPGVASVNERGEITALRRGDAFLIVRFGRYVTNVPLVLDIPLARKPPVIARFQPVNEVDRVLRDRWERLGLAPSSPADDWTFVRRVFLDLIGTLPKPEEALAYVNSRSPNKKEELVDMLLRRPEFIYYWAQWWGDMLRVEKNTMKDPGVRAISQWIRTSLLENKPLDQMARELLTAAGRSFQDGPVNYYLSAPRVEDSVVQFSRVFMGVRMDCAQCHNHPFESWTQNDFYNLAMFFRQMRTRGGPDKDEVTIEDLPKPQPFNIPKRARPTPAQPILPGERNPVETNLNLRHYLARWITAPENPYFARAFANRLWARLMGRGVFEPLDDYRQTNPPTDPVLMQALADLLRKKNYDMRAFLKEIAMSRAYSLTSDTNPANEKDTRYYTHYYTRRVPAEVLADMMAWVTDRPDRYNGYPDGTRAIQLEEPNTYSRFLDIFNRPKRRIVTCERDETPSLTQALFLLNNGAIHAKVTSPEGIVVQWLKAGMSPEEVVDQLYLRALTRYPRPEEKKVVIEELRRTNKSVEVLQDLLWALLNTKEFLYNH